MARICHISIVGPADDQRVFLRECRTLAKAGHDVSMIVRHDREEVRDGVRFIPVRPARNRFVRMIRNVPLALWLALRQRADLYHVHDPELALAGVVLKLLTRAKIVYGVREDHPRMMRHKFYMPWLLRVVMSYLVQFVEQFSSRLFFNAVVAVTDDIGDNFRRHPRVLIIKNYPILTPAPLRKEDGPFTLLYVGSMTKIRGLLGMIETIERMDGDARLLLAGTFGPAELEQEARAMPGWARVDYAGYVDVLQSPEFFARADVGLVVVLPERHHLTALPLKMFDYMGARLPVIASNFPLWSEIVEGNACGICVDPLDPDAMAAAAKRLRDDPALRREMGERGRRAVEEKYNWDSEAKRLLALYDELLA